MSTATCEQLLAQIQKLESLHKVGIALSAEQNPDRLTELILSEAQNLCHADGGTLYLRQDDGDTLRFAILRNRTLGLSQGGTSGNPIHLPDIPMWHDGVPNETNVASCSALRKRSFNLEDVYHAEGFDFSGTQAFDERNQYRSRSMLTIPLINIEGRVLGVLQLINAMDRATNQVVPFTSEDQQIVEALASQAAISLENQRLIELQKQFLESVIRMIASAIDAKSPYTGGHCERVPILTEMLADAACQEAEGPFSGFSLTPGEWYELRIAAWLHDCGKVVTPTHIMDKATKLETITDRIHVVRARFEILRQNIELAYWQGRASGEPEEQLGQQRDEELARLDDDLRFLEAANIGGEFLSPEKQARIDAIAARTYVEHGIVKPLLSDDETRNLRISRGTLTEEERLIINGHMVQTIKMLTALPFPPNLKRVPEYAGGHHETMDGRGYPRGLFAGDMSIPARMMAIADVFEALTAQDRPYKSGKTLSEAMRIMGFMKRDNHLDPDVFDLFVRAGVYRAYGERFLPPELIDAVDEAALLAITPTPFDLPDETTRRARWSDFLSAYRDPPATSAETTPRHIRAKT